VSDVEVGAANKSLLFSNR